MVDWLGEIENEYSIEEPPKISIEELQKELSKLTTQIQSLNKQPVGDSVEEYNGVQGSEQV